MLPVNMKFNSQEEQSILKTLIPGESLVLNLPDDGKFFIIELKGLEVTFYKVEINLTSTKTVTLEYTLVTVSYTHLTLPTTERV